LKEEAEKRRIEEEEQRKLQVKFNFFPQKQKKTNEIF